MNTRKIVLMVILSVLVVYSSQLTFEFNELEKVYGKIFLAVVNDAEIYNGENDPVGENVVFRAVIMVGKKDVHITVDGIKPGKYAAMIFQDLNRNGKLDVNSLKIPKEPYGFSNNVKGPFGKPKYEDILFEVGEKNVVMKIKMF